jgi:hypothetical protein
MTRPLCQHCRRRSRCSVAAMQAPQAEDSYLALSVAWEHGQTEGRRYVRCQATTDAVGREDQARRSIEARRQQRTVRPVQADCRGGRALLGCGLARGFWLSTFLLHDVGEGRPRSGYQMLETALTSTRPALTPACAAPRARFRHLQSWPGLPPPSASAQRAVFNSELTAPWKLVRKASLEWLCRERQRSREARSVPLAIPWCAHEFSRRASA